MMGETFDYISEDGWRYHGEQVGHHPPCSAVTASGRGFEWWQTVQGVHKTTWGGNIELMPEFPVRLRIGGDEYIWNKVKTTILNAASNPENRVIRNEGVMMIKCSNGVECKLVFKGDKNSVNGEIKDKRSGATCKLIGRWDRGLNRQLPGEDQENVFEVPPPHPYARSYYGFSKFSMGLNELFPEDRDKLPYTDSRFRPDMRFLEYADAGRALAAKHQLEGDQRMRAKSGRAARPIWFEFRTDDWSKKNMWLSNERYWRAKQQKFQDDYSQTACHVFGSQESRQ
uniref:Oxysterol-binding protein n=1 Tax=Panagrellus redivivus TaxID=6233 RepID=A0A7E4UUZ3_PANRE